VEQRFQSWIKLGHKIQARKGTAKPRTPTFSTA